MDLTEVSSQCSDSDVTGQAVAVDRPVRCFFSALESFPVLEKITFARLRNRMGYRFASLKWADAYAFLVESEYSRERPSINLMIHYPTSWLKTHDDDVELLWAPSSTSYGHHELLLLGSR